MEYKLPPLPTPFRRSSQQIAADGDDKAFCDLFSNEQLQAYAVAAIEAQGVPDHCDPSCTSYGLASMVMSDCGHSTNNQRLLDRIAARIDKHVEALLAAPPAPQAGEVQQEPVKAWCETCEGSGSVYQEHQAGCWIGGHHKCPDCDGLGFNSISHPAQQAKPQPLTRDQVKDLCTEAGYDKTPVQARADFINGIRHAEAAHGIQGS